ncbi:nitroreductase family protein [Polycladidibacter hongkongensis]|uniref:nitroreductase family protein n=1 Tax=Polycladidibacter hongkongensis TaxID=1647556 RepID=UPI0009E7ACCE|nr:nitroreductase [Pseudovibrio hongkongensis]
MTAKNLEVQNFLMHRRSHLAATLIEPAPQGAELVQILQMAGRVPDHGKLAPWRFVVYADEARAQAGEVLVRLLESRGEVVEGNKRSVELERFLRAPLVVGVISAPARGHKVPVWEQELCVGAVCVSLLNAASSLGYAGQWLSEWYCHDEEANRLLGASEGERFAGFVHLGSASVTPKERPRPDILEKTSYWTS